MLEIKLVLVCTLLTIDDDMDLRTSVPNPTSKIMIRMRRRERGCKQPKKREREKQRKVVPSSGGLPQGAQVANLVGRTGIPSKNLLLDIFSRLSIPLSVFFYLFFIILISLPRDIVRRMFLKETQLLKRLFNCQPREHASVTNLNDHRRDLAEISCTNPRCYRDSTNFLSYPMRLVGFLLKLDQSGGTCF